MQAASASLPKPIALGQHKITTPLMLAPMAGITDLPFRQLCQRHGAGYAISEMLISKPGFEKTAKSTFRRQLDLTAPVRAMQIVGYDAEMMAESAKRHVDMGAEVVDINMGCPAKKVCNVASGSALLRDETLVEQILTQVVAAVDVPVTLKVRTGWCPETRNATRIAQIAEQSGIQMLSIHGRTRADLFKGDAEYATIRSVKASTQLPIVVNGDITSADKAAQVLAYTQADGLMIGRGAQGQPWLFDQILAKLEGRQCKAPDVAALETIVMQHVRHLHEFYGEIMGVRMARKHIRWYLDNNARRLKIGEFVNQFWHTVCRVQSADEQIEILQRFFDRMSSISDAGNNSNDTL